MIGVLVPAHDEEALIGDCLRSLQAAALCPGLAGEPVEILVALDSCTDATAAVCAAHGVRTVALQARCVGRARATAADVLLAMGARWIATTDADSRVPADWLSAQLGCGADAFCGTVRVADWLDFAPRVRAAFLAGERYEDGHPHVHGANLGVSAAAYRAVGGLPAACGARGPGPGGRPGTGWIPAGATRPSRRRDQRKARCARPPRVRRLPAGAGGRRLRPEAGPQGPGESAMSRPRAALSRSAGSGSSSVMRTLSGPSMR